MEVKLISCTQNPIETIETAAKTCYDTQKSKKGKILKHCYKSGHLAMLEFADFHFLVKDISRATTLQIVRHRMASYAQRSQRYCEEQNGKVVVPQTILDNQHALDTYLILAEKTQSTYDSLVKDGIPKEDARFVLTNSYASEINIKMNFRELIHFMNERLCMCAQWEIRELANKMRDLVIAEYPELGEYLVPKCERYKPLCFCTETKSRSCGRYPTVNECAKILKENK